MSVQFIEKNGKKEFAVVPFEDYEKLIAIAENKADEADVLVFRASNELLINTRFIRGTLARRTQSTAATTRQGLYLNLACPGSGVTDRFSNSPPRKYPAP